MTAFQKSLDKILRGTSDSTIDFSALCNVLKRLEFDERIRGAHHIFSRQDVGEIINLQPRGTKAKPYQVKQVRAIILKYRLGGAPDEE